MVLSNPLHSDDSKIPNAFAFGIFTYSLFTIHFSLLTFRYIVRLPAYNWAENPM